jgi:hypothetical protein
MPVVASNSMTLVEMVVAVIDPSAALGSGD